MADGRVYKHVRALERGLDVLSVLNERNGATVGWISERTGVHRTTIYRILETLQELGYVQRTSSGDAYHVTDTYHLTLKVRSLSEGFNDEAWISEIVPPILGDLLREVLWPTDVATFDQDAMVVRETTHRFSPFSVHQAVVGRRAPMLTTALGRTYLSFCSAAERELIIANLRAGRTPDSTYLDEADYVRRIVERTRANGYGSSVGEAEARIASFALPLHAHGRVLACLNIVFFASAMSMEEAVRKYLPAMRRAVEAMEERFNRRESGKTELIQSEEIPVVPESRKLSSIAPATPVGKPLIPAASLRRARD